MLEVVFQDMVGNSEAIAFGWDMLGRGFYCKNSAVWKSYRKGDVVVLVFKCWFQMNGPLSCQEQRVAQSPVISKRRDR